MPRTRAALGKSIRIDIPASNNDYWPLCTSLDGNNFLTASGGTDDVSVVQFLSIHGDITGGPGKDGQCSGTSWSISGIGQLELGKVYCLTVTGTLLHDDGAVESATAHCYFITVRAGYYSCPSGHSPSGTSSQEESPSGTLPRYYRVRLSDEIPGLASPRAGLLLGGLLAPSTVYLAYDPAASVRTAPVWRDVNLPEFIGRWRLRVVTSGCGAAAELVQQTIDPRFVSTGMVFRCANWNGLRPNQFLLVGPEGGVGLSLIVEPA